MTTSPALKSVRDSSTPEAWVAVEDFEGLANIEQVVSVAQRAVRDPQARVAGGVEAEKLDWEGLDEDVVVAEWSGLGETEQLDRGVVSSLSFLICFCASARRATLSTQGMFLNSNV